MWRALIVLAVSVVSASLADQHDSTNTAFAGLRGAIEPRLAASGIRIARLEHEIEQLGHHIEEASDVDPRGFLMEMHNRLDVVQKPKCPRNHVQCGWESTECASTLLLCDGHRDCHNGWDEEESTCSPGGMVAGNVFAGTANWQSCLPFREHPVSMKITAVIKPKYFPARLVVRVHIVGDIPRLNIHREGDFKGYYVYGLKRLVLIPVHQTGGYLHYGIVCDFNYGDDERADCKLMQEVSLHTCATVLMHLQHHDTHHERHGDVEDHRGEIVEHHYDAEGHDHVEHKDD